MEVKTGIFRVGENIEAVDYSKTSVTTYETT
jgi:hypothetical protein